MRIVEFEVKGYIPPRNAGDGSMWTDDTEMSRLLELRREAFEAFGNNPPLGGEIKLEIDVRIPEGHNKPGDLDNFVKGICDGLSAPQKHPDFNLPEVFGTAKNIDFHPDRFRVIEDDNLIFEIHATKKFVDSEEWIYSVRLEGE